jgi:hypothetical protein
MQADFRRCGPDSPRQICVLLHRRPLRTMPGKVSVEPRSNGVFGDDRVGAMMAKYDADKSGSFNAEECARPHVATHTADSRSFMIHPPH